MYCHQFYWVDPSIIFIFQQVKVLEQAVKDLSRLSAQTDAFDGSQFARGYTECQLLFR